MTLPERHNYIMELLRQRGSITVASLAEQLKVSEVTIRKDLNMLEERNMLYRAHGSAILINPYINDRHVNEKEKLFAEFFHNVKATLRQLSIDQSQRWDDAEVQLNTQLDAARTSVHVHSSSAE